MLNLGYFVGRTDNLHPRHGIIDECVDRHHGKHGAYDASRIAIQTDGPPEHGAARDGLGRKIGVGDDQVVSMTHGAQDKKRFRAEQRVNSNKHAMGPSLDRRRHPTKNEKSYQ